MHLKTSVLLLNRYPPAELIRLAQLQEELGYDVFWLADERFFREVYSGLTLVAANTNRIQIGTMVTDPYVRHPAITATSIATVDEISGGRAILGIGAGVSGFAEMKIDRRKPAKAMREMVEVVEALMAGQVVDYHGEIVELERAHLNFEPIRPRVPVYIASYGPLGLILPGEVADGAVMQGAVADGLIDWLVGHVRTGAERAGRDPSAVDIVSRVNLCIHSDSKTAKDMMRSDLVRTLTSQYPEFRIFKTAGVEISPQLREAVRDFRERHGYTHDPELLAPLAAMVPDEIVDAFTLAGSPEEVARLVIAMARRGVTHVMVFPIAVDGRADDVIRRFAEEVMPAVRATLGRDGAPAGVNDGGL